MYDESSTRSYVARSIGPMSGERPPSPKRYTVDRSASETGTFFRVAALVVNACRSPSATVQETGSLRPPCGGMRSPMGWKLPFAGISVERPTLGETRGRLKCGAGSLVLRHEREADQRPVEDRRRIEREPRDDDQERAGDQHVAELHVARRVRDGVAGCA